jgi:hypothetical protein
MVVDADKNYRHISRPICFSSTVTYSKTHPLNSGPTQTEVPHVKREQDDSVQSRANKMLKDKFRRRETTLNQINARYIRLCTRISRFEFSKTRQLEPSSPTHFVVVIVVSLVVDVVGDGAGRY